MTPQAVVEYFGSQAEAARSIGVSPQAVQNWIARKYVPEAMQYKIQVLTKNKLKAGANE